MILTAHKYAGSLDGLIHLRCVAIARGEVGDERCAYHSLTNVCDGLVSQRMSELELQRLVLCAFATDQSKSFRIPSTPIAVSSVITLNSFIPLPREALTANVLEPAIFGGVIEEILIAQHQHAANMHLKLVDTEMQDKYRYRRCHLEKAVTNQLQSLVIRAHTMLEVDLFGVDVVTVVGILCYCFQCERHADVEIDLFAVLDGYEI